MNWRLNHTGNKSYSHHLALLKDHIPKAFLGPFPPDRAVGFVRNFLHKADYFDKNWLNGNKPQLVHSYPLKLQIAIRIYH